MDVFHVTRLDSYTEIVVSEFIVFRRINVYEMDLDH